MATWGSPINYGFEVVLLAGSPEHANVALHVALVALAYPFHLS